MKQGTSNSRPGDRKVEPSSRAVNPGGVSQIGTAIGNHSDKGTSGYRGETLYEGRGYEAPMAGVTTHGCGSQGKH